MIHQWCALTYGGVLCFPFGAIAAFAVIDAGGWLVIFLNWAWERLL